MPLYSDADVSDIESATDGEGNQVPIANDGTYSTTISGEPIDAEETVMTLDTRGKRVLDLAIEGTSGADYVLEASPNGSEWFGPFETFGGSQSINATYRLGARYVRLRVTSAATDGATADGFMGVS